MSHVAYRVDSEGLTLCYPFLQRSFDMWTNRLDLATTPLQAALVGPGAIANPDFLEVAKPGNGMSLTESQAMFTMYVCTFGLDLLAVYLFFF